MSILNLRDPFSQIHFLLTVLMLVCFGLHLKKELTKFFEAKTTTAIKLEKSLTIKMPAITICAEQVSISPTFYLRLFCTEVLNCFAQLFSNYSLAL